MANTRRTFVRGKMDKDLGDRLLPDGAYRHAENILIVNSEGSEVGSIQNSFSTKQLTNYNFGTNVRTTLGFCDEVEDKIYWFVISDQGCYLVEWNNDNGVLSVVLGDTRPEEERVLKLRENFLITGISKVRSENIKENLLVWTDDNMEPCCINIERAKTWAINGFVLEDILLIKKPPRFAPYLTPVYQNDLTNNMEEKYLSFCYRYKYRDGEYSALSDFTNYSFFPKNFELDYYTMDNLGMVNAFNAVRIDFNTGESQVTDIQLVVKESNSLNLYIIETFNKKNEGWDSNQIKNYTFSNSKLYFPLPSKELFRAFDNVPLKAKSLTLIGNRIVFGNYVEGRDLIDVNGNKVFVNYDLSLINEEIEAGEDFSKSFSPTNTMKITNPTAIPLKKGNKMVLYFSLTIDSQASYDNSFFYVLPEGFSTIENLFASDSFSSFMDIVDNDFRNNYLFDFPEDTNYVVTTNPTLSYSLVGGVPTFTVSPVTFEDTLDDSDHTYNFAFTEASFVTITKTANATSLKTNRDYEVGIVYEDTFNRRTTVLTALYNTIYIPQKYSIFKNRIKLALLNPPPVGFDRYKVVVKAKPLEYQTVYVNRFYNDDFYVWCKLEAENKDKVKVGDMLIVKKAADNILINPIKVKVLEIKDQPADFLTTADSEGNPITELAGYYMKIRPDGFLMDFDDYSVYQDSSYDGSMDSPVAYLDLFTRPVEPPTDPVTKKELAIPVGSSVYLYFCSNRKYDDGWKDNVYSHTYYAQRDYATLEEFLNENVMGRPLFGNSGNAISNYQGNLSIVRGRFRGQGPTRYFISSPSGDLYLRVVGTFNGGSKDRQGRIDTKIVVTTNTGFYVFETEPKQVDTETYYETEQTFEIINGNHKGNIQDQDLAAFTPAIIDLDFFNCYTQGNGVESYRVKDAFNKNFLNIDLRPSSSSIGEYGSVRRSADLTYGEPYIESTNLNGLNEFNLSTGNFKELDKDLGSIQKLHSRDNDLLVLQEEKASKVLFGKDALYNADGSVNVTSIAQVLGQQVTYLGQNGIGKDPESFAVNDYQIFYANARRGKILRLSIDGITEIIDGMVDYFRDLFTTKPNAKKLGGFDPYHNQYVIAVGEQPEQIYTLECGNTIAKSQQTTPFSYVLNLNELEGDIVLNYNISQGNATITATFDGADFVASNITGEGSITMPRTTLNVDVVLVTITPVSAAIDYEIGNSCPLGFPMSVVSIVLNDVSDSGKNITDRYRWGVSSFYSEDDLLSAGPITRFETETGIEGQGRFPYRGSIVNLQSYKEALSTAEFSLDNCNRIGYLVSSEDYTESDIASILTEATFLTISELIESFTNKIYEANFLFNRVDSDEKLYLIWDYTDRSPILVDDSVIVDIGDSVVINELLNDTNLGESVISIISAPEHGTATVNIDNTITYENDGENFTADQIIYQASNGECASQATISIFIVNPNQYCTKWNSANNSNVKMSLIGEVDFQDILGGRLIATGASSGIVSSYRIDGVDVPCSIPMTFTTSKAKFNNTALAVVTDRVLTQITFSVSLIFTNHTEFDIIDITATAISIPGVQMTATYNDCD